MVNHEGLPQARLSIAERVRAAQQEKASTPSPEDLRVKQIVEEANQRTAERAKEAGVDVGRSTMAEKLQAKLAEKDGGGVEKVGDSEESVDDNAERAALMRAWALKKRAQKIAIQQEIVEVRNKLLSLPSDSESVPLKKERPEALPPIDRNAVFHITDYGEAMVAFVDEENKIVTFVSPEERRDIDARMNKDESLSSRQAANVPEAITLTFDQVRSLAGEVHNDNVQSIQPDKYKAPLDQRYAA